VTRSSIQSTAPRVGLVLGAGGTAGVAFHAGTLLALEQDLGWDPRSADVIVGTSAGSVVGALLRAGLSTDDLAAWGTAAEPRPDGRDLRRVLDRVDDMGMRFVGPRPRLRVPNPRSWWQFIVPSEVRPHTMVLSRLPHGVIDGATALRATAPLLPDWPERALYLNAVRTADARRVVFGRDAHVPVPDAIAASCAIPGLFRPVRIGRHWYIDGGAHSPTNADVLVGADVDLAVVVSPMSARPGAAGRRPDAALRLVFRRRLQHEVAKIRATGIDVAVFEPSAQTLRAVGWNALDRSRTRSIVSAAFLTADVGRLVDEPSTSVLNRIRQTTPMRVAS
jgi:NTE family protein